MVKRKAGRPKLPKGSKKENFLLRLDPEVSDRVIELAKLEGITRAECIRRMLKEALADEYLLDRCFSQYVLQVKC